MFFAWSFHLLAQDGLSIPQQHDILELVKGSGLLVQLVLYLLIAFSIASWGIIFYKFKQVRKAKKESAEFIEIFWDRRNLSSIHDASRELKASPVAQVFRAGYEFAGIKFGINGGYFRKPRFNLPVGIGGGVDQLFDIGCFQDGFYHGLEDKRRPLRLCGRSHRSVAGRARGKRAAAALRFSACSAGHVGDMTDHEKPSGTSQDEIDELEGGWDTP